MSAPMRNGAGGGDSGQEQKRVDDEENASQNATIQRIQNYRDRVAEYQLLFAQNELSGEVSETEQHRSYHQLASGFLQLLKPYLTDPDIPGSQYYWHGYSGESLSATRKSGDGRILHLGTVPVEPPEAISKPSKEEVEGALRTRNSHTMQRADPRNSVENKSYDIVGLVDFAQAPAEWTEEWEVMFGPEVTPQDLREKIRDPTVRILDRTHRHEPITVVKSVRVPRSAIDAAVTAMENFIRDIGMDIEFEVEPYTGDGGPGL